MSAPATAAGTIVVMGVTYLAAEALATALAVAYVGIAVAIIALALVAIAGIVTFVQTASEAIEARDKAWMFDIVAAPAGASLLGFVMYPINIRVITWAVTGVSSLPTVLPTFDGIGGFFLNVTIVLLLTAIAALCGLAVACAVIAAPVGAVFFMSDSDRMVRLRSYGCYFFTAFYWQTIVIGIVRHDGSLG